MGKNMRRRKLVLEDLQLRIVMHTMFIALPLMVLFFTLVMCDLLAMGADAVSRGMVVELARMVFYDFLITVAVGIPFAVSAGILYSFRFCGPIYRFKMFLGALVEGRWDRPCMLRKGDLLRDVRDALNDGVGTLVATVHAQRALLAEAGDILASAEDTVRDAERLRYILSRIGAVDAELQVRFGEKEAVPKPVPQAAEQPAEVVKA